MLVACNQIIQIELTFCTSLLTSIWCLSNCITFVVDWWCGYMHICIQLCISFKSCFFASTSKLKQCTKFWHCTELALKRHIGCICIMAQDYHIFVTYYLFFPFRLRKSTNNVLNPIYSDFYSLKKLNNKTVLLVFKFQPWVMLHIQSL